MPRPRKQRPISVTPFEGSDGVWRAFLPKLDDYGRPLQDGKGRPARWKREAKTLEEVTEKIRQLEDEQQERITLRAAHVAQLPRATEYRLHTWLRYWRDEMLPNRLTYNGLRDYVYAVDELILPNIDDVVMAELAAADIEAMLKKVRKRGSNDAPNRAYRRLRTALNDAVKRAKETGLYANPIKAVDEPAVPKLKVTPLSTEEVEKVLKVAVTRDNAPRWTVALALGLRQGETLALQWAGLDWQRGILWVTENLYRRKWVHGCDDIDACCDRQRRGHYKACPGSGPKHNRYHRKGCPKPRRPCEPGCQKHARRCPHAHGGYDSNGVKQPGGQVRKPPKSEAGSRPVPVPPPLLAELRRHKAWQDEQRAKAPDRWAEANTDAIFATPLGKVINERTDAGEWKKILELAGVAEARLHDARHTAATMMLLQKIQPAVVMAIMGWSDPKMLKRYQHLTSPMLDAAGEAIADLFYPPAATDHDTASVTDLAKVRARRA